MASPCPGNVSCSLRILQITQHLPISSIFYIRKTSGVMVEIQSKAFPHTLCPRSTDSGECKRVTTHSFSEHNDSPSQDCSGENAAFQEESSSFSGKKNSEKTCRTERGMLAPLACKGKGSSSAAPSWNPELELRCLAELVNPQQGSPTALQGAALVPFPLLVQTFQALHNSHMEQGLSWGLKKRLL